ncbi:cyclic nucleotide-gated ion channel 18-like [Chenopodium quinoa]|uniref:cyclic nucleotide-gated ion channel 18-like n=1 Tax=Chenopodium quinoa TaxID=63459 RepID=UPI000B77AFAD|nr:cyclic nucleotide-gated ion channel 18-like [Chenopodium quinoa]
MARVLLISAFSNLTSESLKCDTAVNEWDPDHAATLDWNELFSRCTEKFSLQCGTYSEALNTKIGTRSFIQKYTFCLAWGLKSLRYFDRMIKPMLQLMVMFMYFPFVTVPLARYSMLAHIPQAIFSFIIVVFGLLLFGDLLAKMQSILQCTEVKEDRQRARQRIVEEWVKYHQLPPPLKKKVKQAIQSEWSATRGVNYEAMLDSLPQNIRSDIRRNLYQEIIGTQSWRENDLLNTPCNDHSGREVISLFIFQMPIFAEMDDVLISAISGYLHTFSSNEGTYVAIEGEPVCQIMFVFGGQLEVSGANNGGQCIILGPGDLCGKELLELCSHPTTTSNLIPATQTIKCVTDVDAFSLRVDDVKLLAIQFHHDGKFRCAFQRYIA